MPSSVFPFLRQPSVATRLTQRPSIEAAVASDNIYLPTDRAGDLPSVRELVLGAAGLALAAFAITVVGSVLGS